MKPRNRDINIFNLSMMDVICGALGAFLIMMVVLVPHYREGAGANQKSAEDVKRLEQELEQARAELKKLAAQLAKMSQGQPVDVQQLMRQLEAARERERQALQRLQQTEQQLSQSRRDAQQMSAKLQSLASAAGSILTIVSVWENPKIDVDMWVRNPNKSWDGPKKETPDGGKLNYQFGSGQSIEMFRDSSAIGRYEVYYRIASRGGVNTAVVPVTAAITRLGVEEKSSRGDAWKQIIQLSEEGKLIPAFAIAIDARGQANLETLAAAAR
jgi:hypothetical protein